MSLAAQKYNFIPCS